MAAGKLPGLTGRDGAFATGGGEAGGAGRAGGTVGIADRGGIGFGAIAGRAAAAGTAPVGGGADVAAAEDVLGVAAAGGAEGRLASAGVVEAGLEPSPARAAGMLVAPELADRAGAALVDVAVDGAAVDAEPAGVSPALADGAAARGAAPAGVDCDDVDFGVANRLAAEAAVSDGVPVTGLRAADDADAVPEAVRAADAAGEAEVSVAGAAARVGGIGASPDPRSLASNIGDAQVPE